MPVVLLVALLVVVLVVVILLVLVTMLVLAPSSQVSWSAQFFSRRRQIRMK